MALYKAEIQGQFRGGIGTDQADLSFSPGRDKVLNDGKMRDQPGSKPKLQNYFHNIHIEKAKTEFQGKSQTLILVSFKFCISQKEILVVVLLK